MSYNLYITADKIGTPTGGGAVTFHESTALATLGDLKIVRPDDSIRDPFAQDTSVLHQCQAILDEADSPPKLAHCYAGCFTETVAYLKRQGVRVTYTAAAHDIKLSRQEHERLGLGYDYQHLNDPALWDLYIKGYQDADMLICPSQHSALVMKEFECKQPIEVIPHGHTPVSQFPMLPEMFTVGYLGAMGPDKGLWSLLAAWKKLGYQDASLLLAGRDSATDWCVSLIGRFGGGNIHLAGWQQNVSHFYNSISVYCQPSFTEGFGIEVLEAMAHARGVICSQGAGAHDVIGMHGCSYPAGDVDKLAGLIDQYKFNWEMLERDGQKNLLESGKYTWERIRNRYVLVWRLLSIPAIIMSDR